LTAEMSFAKLNIVGRRCQLYTLKTE